VDVVDDVKPDDPEPPDPILSELSALVPSDVIETLLGQRDAVPKLVTQLPRGLGKEEQRAWELTGLHLSRVRRFHEALAIFETWYRNVVEHQAKTEGRLHKGAPLVWIRDQHVNLSHTALAQRFMMLTLIEDALASEGGIVDPRLTGSYFRSVWYHGLSDAQFRQYAEQIAAFGKKEPPAARYPERVLQELDKLWMTEFPTTSEALLYPANRQYVAELLSQMGDGTGQALELLAEYLLAVMPGCRTYRRQQTHSTDHDIVCSLDGVELDFRSELGRYFVCESKDWSRPADFSAFAKFARVLDSTKSRFGILFSREGITGEARTRDAAREQLKLFQDRGIVVVVVNLTDIKAVIDGYNFITLLREKYERVRLDLDPGRPGA
jgi:hypothetical protein